MRLLRNRLVQQLADGCGRFIIYRLGAEKAQPKSLLNRANAAVLPGPLPSRL